MDIKNKLIIPKATDLLDLRSITPPPIYNGYGHLPNTQIQTKGEIGRSLITDTHCSIISPSLNLGLQSDYYDLNLQLHSSSVSNPCTFNITNNKTFSGSCIKDNNYTLGSEFIVNEEETDDDIIYSYYYGFSNNYFTSGYWGTISPETYNGINIIAFAYSENNGKTYFVLEGNIVSSIPSITIETGDHSYILSPSYNKWTNVTMYSIQTQLIPDGAQGDDSPILYTFKIY